MAISGWVAVDLDGTLATFDQWTGLERIGAPIAPMVDRVKRMLEDGYDVRIFTARAACSADELPIVERAIKAWCLTHLGRELPITCVKDFGMVMLFDDRCYAVQTNTGKLLGGPEL